MGLADQAGKRKDYLRFLMRYIRSRFTLTPVWAHVFVTRRCNLDCTYCYVHDPSGRTPDMSLATFVSVLQGLKAVRCGMVGFMGGEPTLQTELPQMVAEARAAGMLTHLSTNGLCLTPDYIDRLCKVGLHVYNLSVDSIDHNVTSKKVLDNVRQVVELLVEKRREYAFSLYITQVILPENLDQVLPIVEYCSKLNINIQIIFVDRGDALGDGPVGLGGLDDDESLPALDGIVEQLLVLKQRGYPIATSSAYLRTAQNYAHTGQVPSYCTAGTQSLVVEPSGETRLCSALSDKVHWSGLHASQLTPEVWRGLRKSAKSLRRECNPHCLAGCQFESAYLCRHPWGIALSFLRGSLRHSPK